MVTRRSKKRKAPARKAPGAKEVKVKKSPPARAKKSSPKTGRKKPAKTPPRAPRRTPKPSHAKVARKRRAAPKTVPTGKTKGTQTRKPHARKVAPKAPKRRAPKAPKPRKPRVPKPPQTFAELRAEAVAKDEVAVPHNPFRMGRAKLRGTDARSQERDLPVQLPWEDVHQQELLYRMSQTFEALARKTASLGLDSPTLYARFTFTVRGTVHADLLVGSPPVLHRQKREKLTHWFVRSGLSKTLEGAIAHAESKIEEMDDAISDAREKARAGDEMVFFLEFVACIAYRVEPQEIAHA